MKRYYAVLIFFYTFFLLYMMFYGCGRHPEYGFLKLHPLESINHFFNSSEFFSQTFLVNIVGNILVFTPFGWLGILDKRLDKLPLLLFLFISWISMIELAQLYTARGTADIDDVFLNTLGMLLGYFSLKLVKWLNVANINIELEQNPVGSYRLS
ncbi:VanZ like family protein [Epilithonimonas bovis DSM 19482]|uniref:VanZ like family protein n=1 Tax=Epilithonimonas bovis DSM 19482 TaxID=1121284 RepID=A0A1U7PTQ1_9FLAO|nr:VanZ family protein [Epilithonimonas bovis]QIY84555.1 VanZ family protein [Chryseobacterium sp. NEB161]SIT96935.1 VanZ like family protein [Epilithonimonas bovis DSM 19482]